MNSMPKDPVMLLSVVNTGLRDYYHSLDEFCDHREADKDQIIKTLEKIDYKYDADLNQFV